MKQARITPNQEKFTQNSFKRLLLLSTKLTPKRLFSRTLLIMVAPILILQSVLTLVFIERHWQLVTHRLSEAVVSDIAALLDLYQSRPGWTTKSEFSAIASDNLSIEVSFLKTTKLPLYQDNSFFSLLNDALTSELSSSIDLPFWVDTADNKNPIEVRVKANDAIISFKFRRSRAYASNSHIFLVWMIGTSTILIIISIIFLRNQVRPIQQLAEAAKSFGMGRTITNFKPRGAKEVRVASAAFIKMSGRISRQIEQRTAMLAGVSHDLRTILTRFRLQLALLGDSQEIKELIRDVDDMQQMLESYLEFARTEGDEKAVAVDLPELIRRAKASAESKNSDISVSFSGARRAVVQPNALLRCLSNLINNAVDHGQKIEIEVINAPNRLTFRVEDDGPGIPAEERENVFRPFYRLDRARNVDHDHNIGIGLTIAIDIAKRHGGDILLADSSLGGLRATLRLPL